MKKIALVFLVFGSLNSCKLFNTEKSPNSGEPAVVQALSPADYSGKWFEIAHKPTFFQRNCVQSIAEYAVLDSQTISVKNTCIKEDGSTSDISGKAQIQNQNTPAKLKVDFGYFRTGEYWVVGLETQYKWAVVSNSDKSTLFILARQAPMEKNLLTQIIEDLKARGFDTSDLIYDRY